MQPNVYKENFHQVLETLKNEWVELLTFSFQIENESHENFNKSSVRFSEWIIEDSRDCSKYEGTTVFRYIIDTQENMDAGESLWILNLFALLSPLREISEGDFPLLCLKYCFDLNTIRGTQGDIDYKKGCSILFMVLSMAVDVFGTQ